MYNEEDDIIPSPVDLPNDEAVSPIEDPNVEIVNDAVSDEITSLEEDIIRNDTIPETSRDTPGANGAFAVGAFDTSKNY